MTDHIEQIIAKALLQPCDNHKDRAELARETARQVMEAAPLGVTLKSLEWQDFSSVFDIFGERRSIPLVYYSKASTAFGHYSAGFEQSGLWRLNYPDGVSMTETTGILKIFTSIDEVKSAAQADYERRILSALEPAPSTSYEDGVKEGLRRAARKATSFLVGDPTNGVPLRNPMAREVAAAILSLLTKET